jgi:hypothetical protein
VRGQPQTGKDERLGDLTLNIIVTAGNAADRFQQFLEVNVFGHVVHCAGLHGPSQVSFVAVHAENKNARLGIGDLEAAEHLEAGQIEIEDDQTRSLFAREAQRLPPV